MECQVLGKQLLRSGTSVAANYREASRARSNAEFVSKIELCTNALKRIEVRLLKVTFTRIDDVYVIIAAVWKGE